MARAAADGTGRRSRASAPAASGPGLLGVAAGSATRACGGCAVEGAERGDGLGSAHDHEVEVADAGQLRRAAVGGVDHLVAQLLQAGAQHGGASVGLDGEDAQAARGARASAGAGGPATTSGSKGRSRVKQLPTPGALSAQLAAHQPGELAGQRQAQARAGGPGAGARDALEGCSAVASSSSLRPGRCRRRRHGDAALGRRDADFDAARTVNFTALPIRAASTWRRGPGRRWRRRPRRARVDVDGQLQALAGGGTVQQHQVAGEGGESSGRARR
jgi:hypothetical protein